MIEFAAYYAERTNFDTWAVRYEAPAGRKTVWMTMDFISAIMCARVAEDAYREGFEAGLVAQKYFPQEIRAFGYLPSTP